MDEQIRRALSDLSMGGPQEAPKELAGLIPPRRRGRPRKVERALSDRQFIRDLLLLMETPLHKVKALMRRQPVIMIVFWRLLQKAMEGDSASIREVIKLRKECIRILQEQDPDGASFLEHWERRLAAMPPELVSDADQALLNHLRAQSRKV